MSTKESVTAEIKVMEKNLADAKAKLAELGGDEQPDNRIEPLQYQLKEWNEKVVKRHLPLTDCDRNNPDAISEKITRLEGELEARK